MIGLERAQRHLQICFGALAATLRRFGGQENILAEGWQHRAIDLLRFSVPVNARGVEIVDAEFIGAEGDGLSFIEAAQGKSSAGLADDGQPLTGLSESTLRYV